MNRPTIFSQSALVALLLFTLGVSFSAQAQQKSGYAKRLTDVEMASLPQYCQDRFNYKNVDRWKSTFGQDRYIHLHHYCMGLVYFSRAASEINKKLRINHAKRAEQQFNYVMKSWPANFPLYQQAQMYKMQLEMIN